MNLSDKHPAELDFRKLFDEVKNLLEECENRLLEEDLKRELETIRQKIFDL